MHTWDDEYGHDDDDDKPGQSNCTSPSQTQRTAKRVDAHLRHNDMYYMHEPGQGRPRTRAARGTRAGRRAVAMDSEDEW